MGVEFEVIDAGECRRRHPLITTDNLLGALWDPLDGDIDPAQLCQALARRARKAGAEVQRFNPVAGSVSSGALRLIVKAEKIEQSTPVSLSVCHHWATETNVIDTA